MISILLSILKLFKLGKIGGTAWSMLVSLGFYAMVFGWRYAAGFIGLLFLHEMGRFIAARTKGINVGAPTFIPFVGAWIELKEDLPDAETEAFVGIGGPLLGTIGAIVFYLLGQAVDSKLLLAISYSGFFLNFFNLIPLSPLDGGRVTAVLSPRIWFVGAPIMLALTFYRPSPLLLLVAILSWPALRDAWNYDPEAPENVRYYGVSAQARITYTALYLGLTAYLALMTTRTHAMLEGIS